MKRRIKKWHLVPSCTQAQQHFTVLLDTSGNCAIDRRHRALRATGIPRKVDKFLLQVKALLSNCAWLTLYISTQLCHRANLFGEPNRE